MKKTFALFFSIGLIVLLILTPSLILEGLHINVYRLREEEQAEKYTGTLTLWHVVSFKTGGESGVSFLRNRIREFEKENPYVFIDLVALTAEEANALLAAGERPDILSFPMGFIENAGLLSTLPEAENLLSTYSSAGMVGGLTYAYPYMADFYTLVCNQDMFFYTDAAVPLSTSISREMLFSMLRGISSYAAEKGLCSLSVSDTGGILPSAALLFLREDTGEAVDTELLGALPALGTDGFLNSKAAMCVCPAAEAQKFLTDKRADMLSIRTYSLSDYTDLVQLVGVSSGLGEQKEAMCADFSASLLSTRAQTALEKLCMLPVTAVEEIYEGAPLYLEEYAAMGKTGVVPNAFLFAKNRAAAAALATNALANIRPGENRKEFCSILGL